MILADKIIKHRKQKGWSQEELAEKMGVSRQAVSKWESAQAIPDIEKILALGELFGVSTDYLLKDSFGDGEDFEFSSAATVSSAEDEADTLRYVSKEEASKYIEERKRASWQIALATFLCVLSPIPLIILGGIADTNLIWFTGMDVVIGVLELGALFAFVIASLPFFISCGIRHESYKFLEDSASFVLDTAAKEMTKKLLEQFNTTYITCNVIATCLCVAAPVPVMLGAFSKSGFLVTLLLGATIAMAAVGVFLFVFVGVRRASMQRLLSEGEFAPKEKKKAGILETAGLVYWLILTAFYLAWGFLENAWHINWVIFAVGGVLFAAFMAVMRLIVEKKK
ncbi:MAG: helix-turn-helix transcriptional regulator [Clostridia bacterium]|nr:helix-turn-helix transcriptional regulator [Clostridia bacterium]